MQTDLLHPEILDPGGMTCVIKSSYTVAVRPQFLALPAAVVAYKAQNTIGVAIGRSVTASTS
jgi:hypothetical protein